MVSDEKPHLSIQNLRRIPSKAARVFKRTIPSKEKLDSLKAEQLQPHDDISISDIESGDPGFDRFVYQPRSFKERLAVGAFINNKLGESQCVSIPYRAWCKYILALILAIIAAFFTPQLLPRWLGFEWASPKDLCQNREKKLLILHSKVENMTALPELRYYLNRQKYHQEKCMNQSASLFYHRPARYQWPDECTIEKAGANLTEEVCIGPETRSMCEPVQGFNKLLATITGICQSVTIPKRCETVVDGQRTKELLELEREEAAVGMNTTLVKTQPLTDDGNERVTYLLNKLLAQIDIASDIYIAYSVVAVLIGTPLFIYKREKKTRVLNATLGMSKATFVIAIVIVISVVESFILLVRETDTDKLLRNLSRDPCYVDKEFSKRRLEMVMEACNNVSKIGKESTKSLEKMDQTYFLTKRFALCHNPKETHPRQQDMEELRKRYRDGDLMFPGSCNMTLLNEKISVAPDKNGISKLKAFLGSGVIGQLLLKVILTSWFVHLFAYFEPMILHSGKVEVWNCTRVGSSDEDEYDSDEDVALNEREIRSIVRFAQDKHLLPLIILNIMMVLETVLIIYSIATSEGDSGEVSKNIVPLTRELPLNFSCPFSVRI